VHRPDAPDRLHPTALQWYDSLKDSSQSVLYQPPDWQHARVMAFGLSSYLTADRPSAALFKVWLSGSAQLLTTEGARRRARVDIDR
jgi:hypothetical protein